MRRSSAETKAVILAAARERFAADGYDKATIRAIAADARIDPAMVMRYFGTKEKLFAAAAEFDLELPELASDQAAAGLVRHFLRKWEADEGLQVLLRTGVTNEAAAERMRAIFGAQVMPLVIGLTGDPERAPLRASLVASQLLGLALSRYILKFPPMVATTEDELIAWLSPTIQRYLTE
ncbi:TetR family transcriptional regulator [Microtetraspora sp. AC03309]|uniref:TetR/AcrR family transcriptional regulator n=1 Tax=Microtetraspora sp. AC03309 TaxID=2779376 RepID=UPI001E5BD6EF|nr:TetR family transcriptional regulator [Microtetraspora sp. AC03309]MCC5581005.1 TetR family transcriptional regulator [Microtetraspora sp. AC03309]